MKVKNDLFNQIARAYILSAKVYRDQDDAAGYAR